MKLIAFLIFWVSSFALAAPAREVLIFGKTIRPAHAELIPVILGELKSDLESRGWAVVTSPDPASLEGVESKPVAAIVLLDVSEGVLTETGRASIQSFVERGGGLVALHASVSAGKDWPWFKQLVGAEFADHPPIQAATVRFARPKHVSVKRVADGWSQADEWYNFAAPVSRSVRVIATVDEGSYQGGKMGKRHPIMWSRAAGRGRFWYAAMGHDPSLYLPGTPLAESIAGAVSWVSREKSGASN